MRIVLQRVTRASVDVDGKTVGSIASGLMLLLGVSRTDTTKQADFLVEKVINLRIFTDDAGKMNLSLRDVGGAVLVVSQFTLYGDCRKGRRPSFDKAGSPEHARTLYEYFVDRLKAQYLPVETGIFQAHMKVSLLNDGPVTFLLESE